MAKIQPLMQTDFSRNKSIQSSQLK